MTLILSLYFSLATFCTSMDSPTELCSVRTTALYLSKIFSILFFFLFPLFVVLIPGSNMPLKESIRIYAIGVSVYIHQYIESECIIPRPEQIINKIKEKRKKKVQYLKKFCGTKGVVAFIFNDE